MNIAHSSSLWPFDDSESVRLFAEMTKKLGSWRDGGVAFFGAGTSAAVGFPTWSRLHAMFLEDFGAKPAEVNGDDIYAVRTDIDYHTNRDPARALKFVQRVLGQPVHGTPKAVRLALDTRSLRFFYTTNFDEVLFEAAAGQPVAAYPTYVPMDARFVYLHGRASAAESVHEDLVFGETGYRRAYYDQAGVSPRTKLQLLAPYPLVFIGFSMRDHAVMRSLEEMAAAARRQQGSVDGQGVESLVPLDWYAILPAPPQSDPERLDRKQHEEDRLAGASVSVIWYQEGDADDHRALIGVLQRMERDSRERIVADGGPAFVESLLQAEDLAAVASPSPSDVRRALTILSGPPRIAAEFLKRVDGVEWFRDLRDAGALHPAPSFLTPSGARSAPYWPAADLIMRAAAFSPSDVKDFLLQLETDNWVAIREALRILGELDASSAAALSEPLARRAMGAISVDDSLLYTLTKTAGDLHSSSKPEAALSLIEGALDELATLRPALREGLTSRFTAASVPILAGSESGPGIATRALRAVLEHEYGTPDQDQVRRTRRAIEPSRQNFGRGSVVDLLIDVVRDTLVETDEIESRTRAVARLLESSWPTERRVGIAHCFLRRADLPVHEAAIITSENLSNAALFHELAKLVADNTEDLSGRSANLLMTFVDSLRGSSEDETNPREYRLWAEVLPDRLLGEPFPVTEHDDEDDPDRHLFRDVYFSGVFSPSAPLDREAFAERAEASTASELLALVRDPDRAGVRVTWRHDAEQMWTLLAEYAKSQDHIEPLLEMTPDDLGRSGSWQAVEAMPEAAADDSDRWHALLRWAERTVGEVPDGELWSLALLLERSCGLVPLPLSERAKTIAIQVIERTRRTSWDEQSTLLEDSLLGGYFNLPAGKAMKGLLELMHREVAESDATRDARAPLPQWFQADVLGLLRLDHMAWGVDAWIGLGRYYALLIDRSPAAVSFIALQLDSESSRLSITTLAFWAGYLSSPWVSLDTLERLQPVHQKHARELQRSGMLEPQLRESFFRYVVIGALRGIPGYHDILQDTLSPAFTPEVRGWIASALGREIEAASGDADDQLRSIAIDSFRRYWAEHVEQIGGEDAGQLASYLNWLDEIDLPPAQINHLIEASLDQSTDSFGAHQVVEYLGRYVDDDPERVLALLDRCIDWYRLHWDSWLPVDEVRALLDGLAPRTLDDPLLRRVLDHLTELGATSTEDIRSYLGGRSADPPGNGPQNH